MRAEATLADRNRTPVPAMIEPCERPIMFEFTQTADLAHRRRHRADDVFADGMVEDLISTLSLSGMFKVIAQSATIVYRKNVSDLRTMGRELGVRYLLERNVRRVGANLRVTAQLAEAENAAILWSQKFDRPMTDLAAYRRRW